MAKPDTLARSAAGIGLDFDVLRKDGIAQLQALCGAGWTDYNLHDPGVTILELLCYALTDLAYRTDFGVADYLTAQDGTIDYQRQALYPPQEIMASQALTLNDYGKLVYDAIPEVAEVWLRAAGSGPGRAGLVSIYVMAAQLAEGERAMATTDAAQGAALRAKAAAKLEAKVRALYCGNRSLGEDVAEIRTVKPAPFFLQGEIEIDGARDPAEILAQVFGDCDRCVSSGLSVTRFEDALEQGRELDQLFEGPATRNGHITVRDAAAERKPLAPSELMVVIQAIPGVRRVRNLALVDAEGRACEALPCEPTGGSYPRLQFPRSAVQFEWLRLVPPQGIVFGVSEHMVPARRDWRDRNRQLYAEAELAFKKLNFERVAFRDVSPNGAAQRLAMPRGKHRDFRAYYSIQHQFPAIYGINEAGVPGSASAQRKVEAQQLKAFLFPFEQVMANYLENLQRLPQLFSPDIDTRQTYFSQYLDRRGIPGIEPLYRAPRGQLEQDRAELPPGHDDYYERKGRLLDYLLALYGEEFPQATLRRFNHYHRADTEEWLLHAKARLLRALVELGGRRATAFDYLKGTDGTLNVPPLQWRAGILLGLDQPERQRSFGTVLAQGEFVLVDERRFERGAHPELEHGGGELATPVASSSGGDQPAELPEMAQAFKHISETFFRHGCALENYRIGNAQDGRTVLYYYTGERTRALAAFADRHAAQQAARGYAAALSQLNRACEGLHIVEHILLRPRAGKPFAIDHFDAGRSFFTSRISVVLTGWTLRFHDPEFRNFAEETIRRFCPAHIYPYFHWLDAAQMQEFEASHTLWCARLRSHGQQAGRTGAAALDQAAQALAQFLFARIGGKK